jgi:hypothetical protein
MRTYYQFFGLKILLMRIRILDLVNPGSGIRYGKNQIWDPVRMEK